MTELKVKKPTKAKPLSWGLSRSIRLGIFLVAVCSIASILVSCTGDSAGPIDNGGPRAAIIDQLYSLQPNQALMQEMTQELEAYGFKVDLYQGDNVTVDLYRRLPGYKYKLIIFRTHSGLLGSQRKMKIIEETFLFTNEPYSKTRYATEQLKDQLARTKVGEDSSVFCIGEKFVTQSMEGEFDHTVVAMMGCATLYLPDLCQAFIKKGASACLGWTASVVPSHLDEATANLVQNLCAKELTIGEAVARTMAEKGLDPAYNATLKYYPAKSGDKTIKQLIK